MTGDIVRRRRVRFDSFATVSGYQMWMRGLDGKGREESQIDRLRGVS